MAREPELADPSCIIGDGCCCGAIIYCCGAIIYCCGAIIYCCGAIIYCCGAMLRLEVLMFSLGADLAMKEPNMPPNRPLDSYC